MSALKTSLFIRCCLPYVKQINVKQGQTHGIYWLMMGMCSAQTG